MTDIAIRHSGPYLDDRPLEDAFYLQAYADLAETLHHRGARLWLVKDDSTYMGGNRFAKGWLWKDGVFQEMRTPFNSDVIFNKDSTFSPEDDACVLNSPAFDAFCNDKRNASELFADLCPKTVEIRSPTDIDTAFAAIPSAQIVVKPLAAYGGEGVFIGNRADARERVTSFPYLAQEFIDSSQGIPGVTDAVHDLRIIIMDGEPVFSFYRTPKPGSLISNFALGGWMTPLRRTEWPEDALRFCAHIDSAFHRLFPRRIYSVDCARTIDGTWKLIELNAPPGQQSRTECGAEADFYMEKHADFLLRPPASGIVWKANERRGNGDRAPAAR